MLERLGKVILAIFLTAAVVLGGMLAFNRHILESQNKTVEVVMDYRDLRLMASLSHYPLHQLLKQIKKLGVYSIGLPEEDLKEAAVLGELYYAGGSGIARFKELNPHLNHLVRKRLIDPKKTYVLCEDPNIRKRIYKHLGLALSDKKFRMLGGVVIEIDATPEEVEGLSLGISEAVKRYLQSLGFAVIPRINNDIRYDVEGKVLDLKGYDTLIFEGEEILGFPDMLALTAASMKNANLRYGNVEIVKQAGDNKLKALLGLDVVRVHSIPEDELKKLSYGNVLARLVRAVKERSIRLLYIRPFLPAWGPSSKGSLRAGIDPVKYNLQYLSDLKYKLDQAGYQLGRASTPQRTAPDGWQVIVLGIGVVIIALLLLDSFIRVPWYMMYIIIVLAVFLMVYQGAGSFGYPLEKALALLAAVVFPSYAVISQFSRKEQTVSPLISATLIVINVIAETLLGVFLVIGLLANTQFMLTSQAFMGVKLALLAPVLIVAAYFIFIGEERFSFAKAKERFLNLWYSRIPIYYILVALAVIGGFFVLIARSGNFIIPVAQGEKYLRFMLERILAVRPRFKEFMIGYPMLMLAAYLFVRDRRNYLWVLLSIAVIAPISLFNTFCHVHTPLWISALRSINGMILGIILGWIICLILHFTLKNKWKS